MTEAGWAETAAAAQEAVVMEKAATFSRETLRQATIRATTLVPPPEATAVKPPPKFSHQRLEAELGTYCR